MVPSLLATGNGLFAGTLLNSIGGQALIVFIAVVIISIAIFLASRYIAGRLDRGRRDLVNPLMEQNQRGQQALSDRLENTEKALASFASAMQEYARHMASHTRAIEGLSEASQALKSSAMEQNRILHGLSDTLVKRKTQEEVSRIERAVVDLERRTSIVLQVKDELEKKPPPTVPEPTERTEIREKPVRPAGCKVNPRAFYDR